MSENLPVSKLPVEMTSRKRTRNEDSETDTHFVHSIIP